MAKIMRDQIMISPTLDQVPEEAAPFNSLTYDSQSPNWSLASRNFS
jgi:hypothetical protein